MAERTTTVRLAAVGGNQVKAEFVGVGQAADKAFAQVNRGGSAMGRNLQNVGYQVQDFAVQVAGGTSATRALSQQLPQLLSGFGVLGVVLGTSAAILIPLAGYFFSAASGTEKLVAEMAKAGGTIGSVDSAVSALANVQRSYNEAINATGGASSAAAALVLANSAKEFAARKQNLALELELLNIRRGEQASDLRTVQDQVRASGEYAQGATMFNPDAYYGPEIQKYVNVQPRGIGEINEVLGGFVDKNAASARAIRQLNAELTLTDLTINRTNEALATTFSTITGGGAAAPASGGSTRSGGGGGGGAPAATAAILGMRKEVEATTAFMATFKSAGQSAFADFVTGAKSAKEAAAGLLSSLASVLANRAFETLFSGVATPASGKKGGGGFFSTLLSSVFGGARAAGGPVSAGKAYLVGERGPELFSPGASGMITANNRLGGGVSISIDARGAVEGTDALIARRLREIAPQIVQASVAASRQAAARGR